MKHIVSPRPLATFAFSLFALAVLAADSGQFRGPNRDGIFEEKGLLKSWPQGGPKQLWKATGLGKGFSSIATGKGKVYTTGTLDFKEVLFCFDDSGKELWRREYSPAHDGGGFPGTRGTPTLNGELIYLISATGLAVAIDTKGAIKWSVDTIKTFGAGKSPDELIPRWAISESVLVLDDKVICTPGAPNAAVVALDKLTGKTVWTSKGLSDISGYCSARRYQHGKLDQIVTLTGKQMVGLDPASGKLLWSVAYPASYDIHANSPLFFGDLLYVSDGYRQGGIAFQLAADGKSIKQLWAEKSLDVQIGGAVLLDGRIYGAANNGKWIALDAKTGKVLASGKGTGKGVIVSADGLLYGYGESGKVGIVDPKSADLAVISEFKVTEGAGQHWAHPTISNGRLYLRHGEVMLCYELKR